MLGDNADFVRRFRSMLPRGWFADTAPVTESILSALAAAWQFVYGLITVVTALTRITTAFGSFIDAISSDFFGTRLPRRLGESDHAFILRIKQELFRPRGTRLALTSMLEQLTGKTPKIIEPARPADTGGYRVGGVGYCVGGAYGNLNISHACFVTAFRPDGQGIANLAGYETGGSVVYGNVSMIPTPVSDLDIFAAASGVLPLGCTAWLRIE